MLAICSRPGISRRPTPLPQSLPLDPGKTRGDAALEQRPVEAERNGEVAALDHGIGLLWRPRRAADRYAALQDAFLGARDQRQHFRVVEQAALVDRGCEIAGADHGDIDA